MAASARIKVHPITGVSWTQGRDRGSAIGLKIEYTCLKKERSLRAQCIKSLGLENDGFLGEVWENFIKTGT